MTWTIPGCAVLELPPHAGVEGAGNLRSPICSLTTCSRLSLPCLTRPAGSTAGGASPPWTSTLPLVVQALECTHSQQCRSGHWLREGQAARLIFTIVKVPSYYTEVPRDSLNFSELASNFKVGAAPPSNECRVTAWIETKFSQEHTDKASGLYSLDLQVVKTCYKHLWIIFLFPRRR